MRIYKTRKDFTALNTAGNPGVFAGTVCTITDESTNPMYVFQNNTWTGVVTATTDPITGAIVISPINGQLLASQNPLYKTTGQPWKCAFWGDSRYNAFAAAGPDCVGSTLAMSQTRAPSWITAFMGDAEYSRTYAVSGDQALNWSSAARGSGRTYLDLLTSDSDVVFIQYGVNDVVTGGKTAAQIAGFLQNLIAECFKAGKLVIFESILPIGSAASGSYVALQLVIDATNALMQTWLSYFPNQALYVETAATCKAGGATASPLYIDAADGLHPMRYGAMVCGQLIATAVRTLLPRRINAFNAPGSPSGNLINLTSPSPITSQFNANTTGTATVTQSQGQDANGYYYEWGITTTALAGGYARVECQMSANFQTANPPYSALVGNEILQGSAHIVADDGAGFAPNAYEVCMRQRFYTGTIYNDWGTLNAGPQATDANYSAKLDIRPMTAKLVNATASVVASPSMGTGCVLSVFVTCQQLGFTRLRVYNPQLRRVGYSSTPVSSVVGGSPATITNTTNAPQQYMISGGTVSSITLNAIATGLTSGVFILDPGDSLIVTHTGAPTQVLKQLLTQHSLRGLI